MNAFYYMCLTYFLLLFSCVYGSNINVFVNTTSPLYVVSDWFLGVTLDSGQRYSSANWANLNFTKLTILASALGPGYFRFGGTRADQLVFQANGSEVVHIFTGQDLDLLYNFSKNVGWQLIFDLNQLLRSGPNWNSSNAKEFLDYASSRGYDIFFELGNEPDEYTKGFNITLTGQQVADGYIDLRNLLNTYNLYKNGTIIGPSVAAPNHQFMTDFLNNGGGNAINALTFHHYYFSGVNSTIRDYLNLDTMNYFLHYVNIMTNLSYRPIWLSETGTDWCGCAYNLTTTFAGSFLWLDKLGLSALNGIEVVIRQTIIGASFALLSYELKPHPDYWIIFLYKKLVGNKVYGVTKDVSDPNLRLYGASSKKTNGFVVYGINIANYSFTFDLPQLTNKQVVVYIIKESEPGNLESKTTNLNGELMEWTSHEANVNMKGNVTTLPIEIPAYSQFFIEAGQTPAQQCPEGWYTESTNSNKCLKLVSYYTPPWFAANFDCTTYGINATLLSIQNAFENSEISDWIANSDCNQLYIGLYRNGSTWSWSNGDSSMYKNWKNGFPTSDMAKNCVAFNSKTGDWSNMDCDSSQCFICQQYI